MRLLPLSGIPDEARPWGWLVLTLWSDRGPLKKCFFSLIYTASRVVGVGGMRQRVSCRDPVFRKPADGVHDVYFYLSDIANSNGG